MTQPDSPFTTPQAATAGGAPAMTTAETLTGIFFEPGRTFEALRERPRFLAAALITVAAFMAFSLTYFQRIGYERIIRAEVEVQSRNDSSVTPERKQQAVAIQTGPFVKALRQYSPVVGFAIYFAAGAALYLLGVNLMGGRIDYKRALSVWTYSTLPVMLLMSLLNLLLLFLKPPEEDFEIAQGSTRGLVHANLGILVDASAHPVLASFLGAFDLLSFYGLFLAALGLRKVGRLSSGAAWAVVLTLWGLGVLARVCFALFTGRAS